MLIFKLAAVTCVIYLAVVAVIQAAVIALTRVIGGLFISSTQSKLAAAALFGSVWLVSFLSSWRIVVTPVLSRIPR